ncbi:MAG: hypothetical protein JJU29_09545 [Verrucomicrobia bacterium]|nr:hypothetical protein [Verrucomicrobiota bacterium]MCH8513578.1 hypothetical protein [Kiritimatiellia bacterium]
MLYTNIIHRLDVKPESQASLRFQWEAARQRGLASTTLFSYPALWDANAVSLARELAVDPSQELGLHLHGYNGERVLKRYGVTDPGFWLLSRKIQFDMIAEMVARFIELFGRPPASIGGYVMDATLLSHLQKKYPSIRTAITSCFEEGARMYQGNNRNWMLFSDGGPWAPHWPARANALVPAKNAEEAIDIVALPHLNRDMMMALLSRDDLFASHPGNIVRARVNQGKECPYFFRFLEAWRQQTQHNGWSYLSFFISAPWLSAGHWISDHPEHTRELYLKSLDWMRDLDDVEVLTLSEFGEFFRRRVPAGTPHICHWRDELRESKREFVWFINPHYRAAFDFGLGGTLVDFRPYAGRVDGDVGPETVCQWNGSHPFVISAGLRGGYWNNGWSAGIEANGVRVALHNDRVRCRVERDGNFWRIIADSQTLHLGEGALTLRQTWVLDQSPKIRLIREILSIENVDGSIHIHDQFHGSIGTTEYPEDLRTVHLKTLGGGAEADLPPLRARLELRGEGSEASVTPPSLFKPRFTLSLLTPLSTAKPVTVCLTTSPLTPN